MFNLEKENDSLAKAKKDIPITRIWEGLESYFPPPFNKPITQIMSQNYKKNVLGKLVFFTNVDGINLGNLPFESGSVALSMS